MVKGPKRLLETAHAWGTEAVPSGDLISMEEVKYGVSLKRWLVRRGKGAIRSVDQVIRRSVEDSMTLEWLISNWSQLSRDCYSGSHLRKGLRSIFSYHSNSSFQRVSIKRNNGVSKTT